MRGRRAGSAPQRILHAASLHIRPAEFVCIIGSNGAGKSTLINILAGRALPSAGTVLLNGVDLHRNFQALKQDIAFVPQQDVLHEQLTLRQALDYAAQLRLPPDTTAAQRHAAVSEAARSVDLFDRLDQRIGALSGGQKKCASLASEILNRPSLLFLDEVTSGLDESTDWEIMRLLRRLANDGMTIVVVTHTLAHVAEFCDRVICMGRGGQPTFVGAPSDVLSFFAVGRLGEVFNRMDERGADYWRARFAPTEGATAEDPTATATSPDRERAPDPALFTALGALRRVARQGAILLHRNIRLLLADRRTPHHGGGAERADRRADGLRVRPFRGRAGTGHRGERLAAAARAERDLARLQYGIGGDRWRARDLPARARHQSVHRGVHRRQIRRVLCRSPCCS